MKYSTLYTLNNAFKIFILVTVNTDTEKSQNLRLLLSKIDLYYEGEE